jgi:hypothetical protein
VDIWYKTDDETDEEHDELVQNGLMIMSSSSDEE